MFEYKGESSFDTSPLFDIVMNLVIPVALIAVVLITIGHIVKAFKEKNKKDIGLVIFLGSLISAIILKPDMLLSLGTNIIGFIGSIWGKIYNG